MSKKLTILILGIILSLMMPYATWAKSVLEAIRQTGVLKVGIRTDAPPFGSRNNDGEWQGYCIDNMERLANGLSKKLGREIRLAKVQSTLENRYQIVADGTVHLECGPNTTKSNPPVEGIVYSRGFFVTGTHLLVRPESRRRINPNGSLANVRIGVLEQSNTYDLISSTYSLADLVTYNGISGRERGVTDVVDKKSQAFASDGVLLLGEALRQNFTLENYTLIPDQPLSCDFYGMILPANDEKWENTVNQFINPGTILDSLAESFGSESLYLGITEAALEKCL